MSPLSDLMLERTSKITMGKKNLSFVCPVCLCQNSPRKTLLDGVIEHGGEQVVAGDLRPALRWKIVIVEKLNVLVIVHLK
jgi:hypothetical protein